MRDSDFLGSFAKGLKVIECFDQNSPRLSIADVASNTGLDRATARRCLLTLAQLGYAHYDGKYFELTSRILRLGHAYLSSTPLPRLLQPFLDELSEQVGQSASASVLEGSEIVYIARASQKRVMSINLMAGSRLPAYCSSMGRVLLSALPDSDVIERLEQMERRKLTEHTITEVDALLGELQKIRNIGYAVNNQELEMGLCSIAVPLIGRGGKAVAAINIGAPASLCSVDSLIANYLEPMTQIRKRIEPLLL